jgi:1-acyl-sn-glycerol-3-phosphate acyltransferase
MAKSELFANRFFAWLITSLHAFPVRQGEGDVGAVKETIRRLKEGHIVNVYPEGSRTETGELGPIEPGVALIVRRAGVPIVPVAIQGSYEAWPKHRRIFGPHPIRVMYGPPMDVANLKPREIVQQIEQVLRRLMGELRTRR